MLYSSEQSVLVVVDIQGNLAAAMHDKEPLYGNVILLLKAAGCLRIPVLVTEQVPEKLGATVDEIAGALPPGTAPVSKHSFSCWRCDDFRSRLTNFQRREVILCGIEAHVCVSQTALDLRQADFRVGCVVDATSSRTAENKRLGIERIRSAGGDLLSAEMIVTELLKTAAHPEFKNILQLIK